MQASKTIKLKTNSKNNNADQNMHREHSNPLVQLGPNGWQNKSVSNSLRKARSENTSRKGL